jgi:hypothetical protein
VMKLGMVQAGGMGAGKPAMWPPTAHWGPRIGWAQFPQSRFATTSRFPADHSVQTVLPKEENPSFAHNRPGSTPATLMCRRPWRGSCTSGTSAWTRCGHRPQGCPVSISLPLAFGLSRYGRNGPPRECCNPEGCWSINLRRAEGSARQTPGVGGRTMCECQAQRPAVAID